LASEHIQLQVILLHPAKLDDGLAVFTDADKNKLDILNYVKGKAGIYL